MCSPSEAYCGDIFLSNGGPCRSVKPPMSFVRLVRCTTPREDRALLESGYFAG